MSQTTLLSLFHYQSAGAKIRAFVRMGLPPLRNKKIPGLQFWKPLGTGGGNGFSLRPDFSTYGLLTVFENELQADKFINSTLLKRYLNTSDSHSHIQLHNIQAHGKWSGHEPFQKAVEHDPLKPVCVLTRATIKPKMILKFWKNVPYVSSEIETYEDCLFSKGVGEWPVFMQATFSVWKNTDAMKAYAYKNRGHHEMIKKTRELGWYSEELFARFHPFKQSGNLIPPSQS